MDNDPLNQLRPHMAWFVLAPIVLFAVLSLLMPMLRHRDNRTSDRCWKAGIFYVNPADPELFVKKRLGIGYTLNFGNPWSWVVLAFVTLIAIGPLILSLLYLRISLIRVLR